MTQARDLRRIRESRHGRRRTRIQEPDRRRILAHLRLPAEGMDGRGLQK